MPDSWAWLDALAGELDDDFVSSVREQPEGRRVTTASVTRSEVVGEALKR